MKEYATFVTHDVSYPYGNSGWPGEGITYSRRDARDDTGEPRGNGFIQKLQHVGWKVIAAGVQADEPGRHANPRYVFFLEREIPDDDRKH